MFYQWIISWYDMNKVFNSKCWHVSLICSISLIINVSRSSDLNSDWNENQKIPSNRRTKVELRKCQFSPPGAQFYLQSALDCSHGTETRNRKNFGYLLWVSCDQNWCEDYKIFISDQEAEIRIYTVKKRFMAPTRAQWFLMSAGPCVWHKLVKSTCSP